MLQNQRSRSAFTIVELLVAVTITVLIVVLLGTMFGSLMKTTSRANQRVDSFRDARAALQLMERDFSGLVRTQWDIRSSPVPTPPPTPITRPAAYLALKTIRPDPAAGNQQIYALIAAKNSGLGDVCSVGYYCDWDGHAYSLRRFFRNSSETYKVLSSPSPQPNPPSYLPDSDLYDNPSPSPTPIDDVLARYVWNLRITSYDASGSVLATPYPLVCDSSATSNNPLPAAIEISFSAMSPEAARTIVSVSNDPMDWMDSTRSRYKLLVAPNAYEFRTRIKF
jgi:type II secretory pathway pseudopilin PulG